MKIKKKSINVAVFSIVASLGVILFSSQSISGSNSNIQVIELKDDTINPATAEYIVKAIEGAQKVGAECLIIKLDTPGGLLNSTRLIVKKILTSKVPVIVYISPSGSRAGSAGVFITYASHIAAMAPSTNIGAAHPVNLGGKSPKGKYEKWDDLKEIIKDLRSIKRQGEDFNEDKETDLNNNPDDKLNSSGGNSFPKISDEDPMSSKILNDTVAFIKSIAQERNRNMEWGILSVTKSQSITANEALEKGVVELIAISDQDLLEKLDGREVVIDGKKILLETKNKNIEYIKMDARQQFFNVLANPNIAYYLMILGFYGLLFEITHPGIGVPGILGSIFLILAFYSMQTLPTNFAGLSLFILGLVLLVSEIYVPGFGLLTLGGSVCMVLGSMLLFESIDPVMQVSKAIIFSFTISTSFITFVLLRLVLKAQRSKHLGGREGLIGSIGEAHTQILPPKKGKVFIHGEIWTALSDVEINKGDPVCVTEVDGLILKVEKKL